MKKILSAIAIAFTLATSAQALEVGAYGTRNLAGADSTATGVTVGQAFGPFTATAFADRTLNKGKDLNRFGVLGAYDFAKIGPVSFNVQAGLDRVVAKEGTGYAALVGVGAEYAVTKNVALTLDFRNQHGQSRISQFNGNSISAGAKYSF